MEELHLLQRRGLGREKRREGRGAIEEGSMAPQWVSAGVCEDDAGMLRECFPDY